jgi:hypothetical protein
VASADRPFGGGGGENVSDALLTMKEREEQWP